MSYKVKKGLEKRLLIGGMYPVYFYSWWGIITLCGFMGVVDLLSVLNRKISIGGGILLVIFFFILVFGSKIFLITKSRPKPPKSTHNVTVSNMDVMKFLK